MKPSSCAAALAAVLVAMPAHGQTVLQADGAVNVGYTRTTSTLQSSRSAFVELRPGVALQFTSPRLMWRLGYRFTGTRNLDGDGVNTYSNLAEASLAALLSPRSNLLLNIGVLQGSAGNQLIQRAAEAGQPEFRSPANPSLVTATFGESFLYEPSEDLRFSQSIQAVYSAPQDSPAEGSLVVTAPVALDYVFTNDTAGGEFRPGLSMLRTLSASGETLVIVRSAALGRWTHDLGWWWSGQLTAGVEQVLTLSGSYPLALVPTASVTARYRRENLGASASWTHGTFADPQTGTVTQADRFFLRGVLNLDELRPRTVSFSAGFMHSEPLGPATALNAAGVGNVVQADLGIAWSVLDAWLPDAVLVTARYTIAYQYGQPAGIQPSLVHAALAGFLVRYRTERYSPPMPTAGGRVDRSDAIGFPGDEGTRR